MNLASLFSRAEAQALPEGSKEHALAILGLRQFWHAIFDPCPEFSRLFGDKNPEYLHPFLERAGRDHLSMRWMLHAHFLLWMKEAHPKDLTPALSQELLAATAARWANFDQTDANGALFYFTDMAELGVAAWKVRSAQEDARVVLIGLVPPRVPSPGIYFAAFQELQYPEKPDWRPIPA